MWNLLSRVITATTSPQQQPSSLTQQHQLAAAVTTTRYNPDCDDTQKSLLLHLPYDVIQIVLHALDWRSLVRCGEVSKSLRKLCQGTKRHDEGDDELWSVHCNTEWFGKYFMEKPRFANIDSFRRAWIESKRGPQDFNPETELPLMHFSMRFTEPGMLMFNPTDGTGLHRCFKAGGVYWFRPDDPFFMTWMDEHGVPQRQLSWRWIRDKYGALFIQLAEFPPMPVVRDPHTWQWVLVGRWTIHRSASDTNDKVLRF